MKHSKFFEIDARVLLSLGRDSIKDKTTALTELVKNSYDADADAVDIDIFSQAHGSPAYVRVADNGTGMTETQVDGLWLRIGYSHKLAEKTSSLRGRRRTGEKGIGRLSADRLGASLILKTKANNATAYGLRVDWERFNQPGQSLGLVPVDVIPADDARFPDSADGAKAQSGTELICTQLREQWTGEDLLELREELSTLISPFGGIQDFTISLHTNIAPELAGPIEPVGFDNATVELEANFDGTGVVRYRTHSLGRRSEAFETISWEQFIQTKESNNITSLGAVDVRLLFFPRTPEVMRDLKLSMSKLREFLDRNVGVRIYRDGVRVKPYGNPDSPDGDWLGLGDRKARDPAGPSRRSFRVAPNQLVGAVFISRDANPKLVDSAAREGLVHSTEFVLLHDFVMRCVEHLEQEYHEQFAEKKEEKAPSGTSIERDVKLLGGSLENLARNLRDVRKTIPQAKSGKIAESLRQIEQVATQLDTTKRSIEMVAQQPTIYRGLASIGIAATVFGHETQSSVSQMVASADTAAALLKAKPPDVGGSREEIAVAVKHAKRVASWGAFALSRVRRDKRKMRRVDVRQLVENMVSDLEPALQASGIAAELRLKSVIGRTFAMDVESVLLNLLTNAYSACLQTSKGRRISIGLSPARVQNKAGFEISVSDSGPGVAPKFKERIWEPLFSTKKNERDLQVGTGLGLAIVQAVVDELGGERGVEVDPDLRGARFRVRLPLRDS